jgi:hypothetical protein
MDRIKCAYVKLPADEQKTDVAEVEQVLNCKVLQGLGVEADLPPPYHDAIDIVVPAYWDLFIRDKKSAGGANIEDFPDLLMFSDSVNEVMFNFRYGPAEATFSITPTSLRQMEKLMWELRDADKLRFAVEELRENLDEFKAGASQLDDFSTDLNAWGDSIELHLQDVRRVVELRAQSLAAMFKSGWL